MLYNIRLLLCDITGQLKKGIIQITGANAVNKMVAMLSNMVITRLMTQQSYGIWSYVLNIYSYLNLLSGLGLLSGAFQFGAENSAKKKEFSFYKYCFFTGFGINVILVVGFVIGTFFVRISFPDASLIVRATAPLLLLEFTLNLLLTILRCESRISEYARILNYNTVLMAVFTCIGAFWGIWGILAGRYLALFLSLVHILLYTRKEIQCIKSAFPITKNDKKSLWHYSLFTGASAVLNQVMYVLDITMIAAMLSNATDIAVYKVATLIPTALSFIPNSIITAILPKIIFHKNDRIWLQKNIKKAISGMFVFNLCLCIILVIFAPLIISLVSGTQYLPAVPAFRILVAGYFFSGTFRSLSVNILAGLRYVNYNLFISVSSIFCDVIFNWYMINRYGMVGAAYATFSVIIITTLLSVSYLFWILYRKME